jgi:hypothetical protein
MCETFRERVILSLAGNGSEGKDNKKQKFQVLVAKCCLHRNLYLLPQIYPSDMYRQLCHGKVKAPNALIYCK